MRRLDTAYGIVRKTVFAACVGRPVSEWRAAVTVALNQLKQDGYLRSWHITTINKRLKGVVVRIYPTHLPPASVSIIPDSAL